MLHYGLQLISQKERINSLWYKLVKTVLTNSGYVQLLTQPRIHIEM